MTRHSAEFRAFVIAVATFLTVAILGVALGPAPPSGDESEYFAMTYALATNASPTLTPTVINSIEAAPPVSVKAIDGSDDALHFWLFSALATPFFLLCKAAGLDWKHCYVFVNAIAFAAAVGMAAFHFRLRAAVLLLIGLSASPLFPFLNKAHPEAFSVSLLAVALILLAHGRPLAAALALSLISAQVTAFSPLAAILLMYWAARLGAARRHPTRSELAMVAACVALLMLQPLWTLWRHHTLNLIVAAGYVKPELISLRRLSGILIDPDIGLLLSWPLGAALALLTMIGLWRDPVLLRKYPAYWIFVTAVAGYLCLIGAQQTGYTTGIPRYSLWFLPLCLVTLVLVYERATKAWATTIAVVCIAGSAANLYATAQLTGFQPTLKRRPQAELWYRALPAVYDPEEQVFADYTLGEPRAFSYELFLRGRYPLHKLGDPHTWALSNKGCTKLLVFAYAFTSSQVSSRLPFGCQQPLDPAQLLAYVRRAGGSTMRDRFVDIPERELNQMRLPAFPPTPAVPANRPPRVESIATSDHAYVLLISDPDGWQDIDSTFLTIAGAGCYIVYNQPRNALFIAKTLVKEPRPETLTDGVPGRPGLLRGEHCTVNPETVTVTATGESLRLTIPVALDPPFDTAQVQTGVTDFAQLRSGSTEAFNLYAPPPNAAADVTLAAGDTLKVNIRPGPDFPNLSHIWLLINDRLDPTRACYVGIEPKTRTIHLTPDDTAAPALTMRLGETGLLENGQCAIDGKDSTLAVHPDGLELNLRLVRKKPFAAPKRVWAGYQDESGKTKSWREIGVL